MIITGKYPNLRLRRNRKENWTRRLVKENTLSVNDLVLPIFIVEGIDYRFDVVSILFKEDDTNPNIELFKSAFTADGAFN